MSASRLAVVVIGRNEGERLARCLESLFASKQVSTVVYVDSGSTDNSVNLAKQLGCHVVSLDMNIPFTAARARNEGFACALLHESDLEFVQFVDGDCEVVSGWLQTAVDFLMTQPDVAAVCGRRRERHPEHSVYNQLCDIEWNTLPGSVKACGGDVMMRAPALAAVGGYRPSLIAGEEPELCVRLRAKGWKIWRLDREMTLHDAAMTLLSQWWRRSQRAGYAFAEGAALHGAPPERHYVREMSSATVWAGLLPIAVIGVSFWQPWGLLGFLLYPLQIIRLARSNKLPGAMAWWRAFYLVLGKFPEFQGVCKYRWNRILGKAGTLIEYK